MAKLILPDEKNLAHSGKFEVYEYRHWFPPVRLVYLGRLKMCLGFLEPCARVLDVGYGDGMLLKSLANSCSEVHGIDVQGCGGIVLEMARREGMEGKVFLRDASVLKMPYKGEFFDAVVCISVLEHVGDAEKAAAELFRVLKKGGRLIVGLPIEGMLTMAAWKVFRMQAGAAEGHVTGRDEVRRALGKRFALKAQKKMPGWPVPDSFSLYEALLYEK